MACLTDNTVAAFLEGALPGQRQGRVRSHLESCPSCRSLLQALEGAAPETGSGDTLIGTVLGGSYEVLQRIGAGGMSTVYAARHLRLERRVAIKVLSAELRHHPDAMERFAREARICGGLGSPHIALVFDFDHTTGGAPFMVIELLKGEDLAQRLALDGAMAPGLLCDLLRQACDGLSAAHAESIVHRDIKPSNLFLCDRDGPTPLLKLLDFGISKVRGQLASLTGTQQILGTPGYMSPEMASGRVHQVDARSDLFSLGAVIYEALSGRAPFAAESIPATLFRITYEEPMPLPELRPDLPAPLHALVVDLLQKDPARRPQSAAEVKERLSGLLDERLPATRRDLARVTVRAGRSRRNALVLAGAGLALVTGAGAAWFLGGGHKAAPVAPVVGAPAPDALRGAARPAPRPPSASGPHVQNASAASQPAEAHPDAGVRRPARRPGSRQKNTDNDPLL